MGKPPTRRPLAPPKKRKPTAANDSGPLPPLPPEPPPEPLPPTRAAPPEPQAIAPLWDAIDADPPFQIPLSYAKQGYTMIFRTVLSEATGKMERVYCGNVNAEAGLSDLRRQFGPGRYYLQLRIGQKNVAARTVAIDGVEQGSLPFGPLGELPSGLLTLTQSDPTTAALFGMFQIMLAQSRDDAQRTLQMTAGFVDRLASQYGAANINGSLREDVKALRERIKELEGERDGVLKRSHELEIEKVKRKYRDKDGSDWVEVAKAAVEIAPDVMGMLPEKVKNFLGSLIEGGAPSTSAPQLPAGALEHPKQ